MVTAFEWFALTCILLVSLAGGYLPFSRRDAAQRTDGFPTGQAFAAGVFLALSLGIMLPNGSHLYGKAFPSVKYPLASVTALFAYIFMLALGHFAAAKKHPRGRESRLTPPAIPVIMTVMIAIPSFLLGTALGVSSTDQAVVIFIAIVLHKGSGGFALALAMVRSTMTRAQTFMLYGLFACATPIGILVGADVHDHLSGQVMLLAKAIILSLASGVFFYMGTLHEMKHAPLIIHCCNVRGFGVMVLGLIVTLVVRLLLGMAHTGHPG